MTEYLAGIVFIILGLVLILLGVLAQQRARRTQSWPVTPGTVLNSDVRTHSHYDSDSHHTRTTYQPVVEYQYSVMGQLFKNSRLGFGSNSFNKKKAYEIVSRYPAGSAVNVHYNPEKIEEAVLETAAFGSKMNIVLGAVFVIIGLVLLILL